MIMINLTESEQKAIAGLDGQEIDRLIREAIQSEQSIELGRRLYDCGAHIASRLRYFDKALARHRAAKSAKKRAQTESEARHEGYELSGAIAAMQNRVREDQEDAERFFVGGSGLNGPHIHDIAYGEATNLIRQLIARIDNPTAPAEADAEANGLEL